MLAVIKFLSLSLLILRPLKHIFQSITLDLLHSRCEFNILYCKRLLFMIHNKQSNYFSFEWNIAIIRNPFNFVDILIRENNHKIFFDLKFPKRNQLIRIA